MSYNDATKNELLLTYSFNFNYAVAMTYMNDAKSEFYIPRFNVLAKRWNNEDSQGNIYLSAGSGIEKFNAKSYGVNLGEIVADWESRKYYTYFEHLYLQRWNEDNVMMPDKSYNHSKLRLGFAPFLADYNDLNVWFITQFERHDVGTTEDNRIEAAQFLRFYMKNVLWEVGAGFNKTIAFNFMIHL